MNPFALIGVFGALAGLAGVAGHKMVKAKTTQDLNDGHYDFCGYRRPDGTATGHFDHTKYTGKP